MTESNSLGFVRILLLVLACSPVFLGHLSSCSSARAAAPVDPGPLRAVNALFEAMGANDRAAAETLLVPGISFVTAAEKGAQVLPARRWLDLIADPGGEISEGFSEEPVVLVEGDIAMVWGRYLFRWNGEDHHGGIDVFTLLRVGDAWKIAAVGFTSEPTPAK